MTKFWRRVNTSSVCATKMREISLFGTKYTRRSSKSSPMLSIYMNHLPKMNSNNRIVIDTMGISTINLKNHLGVLVLDKIQQRHTALSHWIQLQNLDGIFKTAIWRLWKAKSSRWIQKEVTLNGGEFAPVLLQTGPRWRSSQESGRQTGRPPSAQGMKKENLREPDGEYLGDSREGGAQENGPSKWLMKCWAHPWTARPGCDTIQHVKDFQNGANRQLDRSQPDHQMEHVGHRSR